MIQEYVWEVKVKNTPLLKKKCNRCDNSRFYCSEKFRMNAQKKSIDIWLIYKCTKCNSTYNATIITRTKPEVINKELFGKFSDNHTETAWKHAFSAETARVNGLEFDFARVEYYIESNGHSLENLINCGNEIVTFKIKYPFNFNLKISTIIKETLRISTKQLIQLMDGDVISIHSKCLKKRDKAKSGQVVKIDVERLKVIYNLWVNGH